MAWRCKCWLISTQPAARSIPEQAPERVPRAARRQERVPRLVDVAGRERDRLLARERPREEVALRQRRSNRKDVGRVGAAFQLELVGPLGLARLARGVHGATRREDAAEETLNRATSRSWRYYLERAQHWILSGTMIRLMLCYRHTGMALGTSTLLR